MKRYTVILAIAGLSCAVFGTGLIGFAAEDDAAPQGVGMTVTGLNQALAVELKLVSEEDAAKAPDKYRRVLKVTEAKKEDGEAVWELNGKALHYVYSEESEALLSDASFHNTKVVVSGKVFENEQALLVASFALAEEAADSFDDEFLLEGGIGSRSTAVPFDFGDDFE